MRDFYVDCGLPAERIRVIPNGVPAAPATETTRGQILAELGLPEHSRLVGLVGPLWPQKRVKDAIWAADLLKVIRDNVHLLVIGDGPHRDRLVRFREQVEIEDKVHFLGQRNDVPHWMPHFDVLWSTSGHEGQSNAVLEAMAAGVPGGGHGHSRHPRPGRARPDRFPRQGRASGRFARWTNQLLDDAPLAQRLGQSARQRACNRVRRRDDGFALRRVVRGTGWLGAGGRGPGLEKPPDCVRGAAVRSARCRFSACGFARQAVPESTTSGSALSAFPPPGPVACCPEATSAPVPPAFANAQQTAIRKSLCGK